MNILGIDTSSTIASVSILKNQKVITMQDENNVTHSERLLKLIDNALKVTQTKLNELDYLMTTNGPGSFTGSRIGAVTIKGLSAPLNLKIIAVSSIEIIALKEYLNLNTKEEKIICAMMDAKNNRAYYGVFKFETLPNGKIVYSTLFEISNDIISNILNKLSNLHSIIVCGDLHLDKSQTSSILSLIISENEIKPNSSYLIDYYNNISAEIIQNHVKDTYTLDITYARMSQAERIKNGEKD